MSTSLFDIINFENVLIQTEITRTINSCKDNKDEDFIKELSYKNHCKLIGSLIYSYLLSKGVSNAKEITRIYFENIENDLSDYRGEIPSEQIITLCEISHIAYLNSKINYKNGNVTRQKSKENLIEKGAVYTRNTITDEIVEKSIVAFEQRNGISNNIKILDFACGTGRFYGSVVSSLKRRGFDIQNIILNNVYAIDIDPIAVNITRLKAVDYLNCITEDILTTIANHILLRNGLIRNGLLFNDELAISENDMGGLLNGLFDIVVSNPPYMVLKVNKNKGGGLLAKKVQQQVSFFRTSGYYQYSIEGMLNYYQLSIEMMLHFLKENGVLGVICPSSLCADVSSTKLRKHLLTKHKITEIKYFAEKIPLFENVAQATTIFYLIKNEPTCQIKIYVDKDEFTVEMQLIKQLFGTNYEIPFIAEIGWNILSKLVKEQPLKSYTRIRNKRGELDLTLYKDYIVKTKTPLRLVRGNMIGDDEIKNINGEYVLESFVASKSSEYIENDYGRNRLICPQISNAGCKRRLHFVFCEQNDVLGNSCNYLSSDTITLKKLEMILNSSLLNWRFKITSTNNHINNYELDELPIVDLDIIDLEKHNLSQIDLDKYICELYGLSEIETEYIISQ